MAAQTIESETKYQALIPKLVEAYSMTPGLTDSLHLAEQANELIPVSYSLSSVFAADLPTADFKLTTSHSALAHSVNEWVRFLTDRQQEVREFAKLICYHAVAIRSQGQTGPQERATALESARRPLIKAIDQVIKPIPQFVITDRVTQPLPIVQSQTTAWLNDACHSIASQLLLSLHVLVKSNVVGVIEWPVETTCKLHFFRHVVTQDQIKSKSTQRVQTKTNADSTRKRTVEWWEQTEGRNVFTIERHEHHIMDATSKPYDLASDRQRMKDDNPIPLQHEQFLQRIPAWILKYIRVVEGNLVLEKVETAHIRKETFSSKPIRSSVNEETLPAIRTTFEFDPAIVLGHYVLTGWSKADIDKERLRRSQVANQMQSIQPHTDNGRKDAGVAYHSTAPYTTACVVGSCLMMLFSGLQPTVMIPLSLLMSAVSVILGWNCFGSYSRWQRGEFDLLYVAAGTGTIAFGLVAVLGLLSGLMYGRTELVLVAIFMAIGAQVVWRIAQARRPD